MADLGIKLTPEETANAFGGMKVTPEEASAEPAQSTPGLFDRISDRLATGVGRVVDFGRKAGSAIGTSIGENIDTAGRFAQHPIDELIAEARNPVPHPERARAALRGVDDLVTIGYGNKLASKLDPGLAAREANDPEEYRALGQAAGMFTPGVASTITKGAGTLVKGATSALKPANLPLAAALGAGRAAASYEASAPAMSYLSADSAGNRMGAAREAAEDPAGLLMSIAPGAAGGVASRLSEEAPERVLARAKKDITTGDQNAGKRKTEKLAAAAGPEDVKLKELFGRDPDLYKTIATKARNSPGKALTAVEDVRTDKLDRLNQIYEDMGKANRLVTPSDISIEFDKMIGDKLRAGQKNDLRILRKERADFLNEYGKFGKLSAETMRGLKENAGQGAFEGMPIPGNVRSDIWKVYSSAIERQAKGTPGVNLDELKGLNRDMSVLIPAKDALQERATSAAAGRHSIGTHIGRAAMAGAGFAHGGVKEAILGAALPELAKAGGNTVRRADYELATRFGGAAPDLSSAPGARAAEVEYATRVAAGMKNGLSLADAVKAAEEE